jgi:hypothetical protein
MAGSLAPKWKSLRRRPVSVGSSQFSKGNHGQAFRYAPAGSESLFLSGDFRSMRLARTTGERGAPAITIRAKNRGFVTQAWG